ncbi:sodium:calcium antiporter [Solimonas flava]|uniref:sodium:calcium antiporter n=1 Tax=Solimonas flava TaxID=415849 RepID=UPI0003FB566F|nr:sodium:calcium antiporter [Solimonas flava]
MAPVLTLWAQFLLCLALIGLGGPELCRSGEAIARRTGLSGSWIGLALLATVTSLPELVTGLSAAGVAEAPDIAAGDVLGSCIFNLAILGALVVGLRRRPVFTVVSRTHLMTAAFGVVLLALALTGLLVAPRAALPAFGHVGVFSLLLLVAYALAMRAIFTGEAAQATPPAAASDGPGPSLSAALARYIGAAIVVAAAGVWLPLVGEQLAEAMHWKQSFVGTLLIAGATSMPEIVVTVAAARIGAIDMAIGNLLGSNLFNVLLLAFDDVAYRPGPLLAAVAPIHATTAAVALLMTGIVLAALASAGGTHQRQRWAGWALLLAYLLNTWLVYRDP